MAVFPRNSVEAPVHARSATGESLNADSVVDVPIPEEEEDDQPQMVSAPSSAVLFSTVRFSFQLGSLVQELTTILAAHLPRSSHLPQSSRLSPRKPETRCLDQEHQAIRPRHPEPPQQSRR